MKTKDFNAWCRRKESDRFTCLDFDSFFGTKISSYKNESNLKICKLKISFDFTKMIHDPVTHISNLNSRNKL